MTLRQRINHELENFHSGVEYHVMSPEQFTMALDAYTDRILTEVREAMQPIFDRITEHEAQARRLRAAIHDLRCSVDASEFDDVVASYLHPGDLDPVGGDDELPR